MATIGVTRGLGDHDLKVHDSNIYIKPFLSSAPEVPQEVFISLLCKNVFSITPPWLSPRIQAAASSGPVCFGIVSHVCFFPPPHFHFSRPGSQVATRPSGIPCLLNPAQYCHQSSFPKQLLWYLFAQKPSTTPHDSENKAHTPSRGIVIIYYNKL